MMEREFIDRDDDVSAHDERNHLTTDAVSTGATGAALGAVLGFVILPGIGEIPGSLLGAVLGAGLAAANARHGRSGSAN